MVGEAPVLMGLGELLWDCFPDRRLPGGAPANVAFHAAQLGMQGRVVTRVGDDLLGRELREFLRQQQLDTTLVQQDAVHGTGTVTITLGPDGSASYVFLENSAWDFLELTPELQHAVAGTAAIVYGTLAQRGPVSRATIQAVLRQLPAGCLAIYDINLRPPFYQVEWIRDSLPSAKIIKFNDEEAAILGPLLAGKALSELEFAQWLLDHYPAELVCVTRGSRGCFLRSRDESISAKVNPARVVDTVGAGDSFSAALAWCWLNRWPLEATARFASAVAAKVVAHPGAMPVLAAEFAELKSRMALPVPMIGGEQEQPS